MNRFTCTLTLLLLLCSVSARALIQWEREPLVLDIGGSARTFCFLSDTPPGATGGGEALALERLRTEARVWLGGTVEVNVAWDLNLLIGIAGAEAMALGRIPHLRIDDLKPELATGVNYSLLGNLDRLNLRWSLPRGEIVFGRQAATLGCAMMLPSQDILAPFSPGTLDTENKPGCDALRVSIPLGLTHEVELYGVAHRDDMEEGIYLLRWHSALSALGFSLLGGKSYGEPTWAADLSGEVGGTGLYCEALTRLRPEGEDLLRLTLGIQRQLTPTLYCAAEYHRDSSGSVAPADYATRMFDESFRRGETALLGRDYSAITLDWQAHPLLSFSAFWLRNLNDDSACFQPALSWDFGENTAVGLGAAVCLGEEGAQGAQGADEYGSEFGGRPDTWFTEIRLYF
ncbi:MAG: hypothetical protein GY835_13935 [bacterium]|nr:hypothetical protein [bacterium]